MDVVTLKNGSEEAKPAVMVAMASLKMLFDRWPMAFYDLVMKCRDSSYSFFGDNKNILTGLSLLQNDGELHGTIRNIVLSATKGEGLDLTLGSPIK